MSFFASSAVAPELYAVFSAVAPLASAAAIGERVVKVVHGYGSTGRGCGRLRTAARRWGRNDARVGVSVKGEDFSIFNPHARYLIEKFPYVGKDPDLENANPGITIFFINSKK